EEFGDGFGKADPDEEILNRLAAVALSMELLRRDRLDRLAGRIGTQPGWREDWIVALGRRHIALRTPSGVAMSPIELDVILPGETRPLVVTSRWTPGDLLWDGTVDREPFVVQVKPAVAGMRLRWRS